MRIYTALILFVCASLSCTDGSQTAGTRGEDTGLSSGADTALSVNCYAYYNNRDTIVLTLRRDGSRLSGRLLYNLYEKDRNEGAFTGEMRGDTLVADYRFHSEGVESVREIAFLQQGGTLTEGFGPVEEAEGKMQFADTGRITFSGPSLGQVTCAGLPFRAE